MTGDCGCAPGVACACPPANGVRELALSLGASAAALVAQLGVTVKVGLGARGAIHGRNEVLRQLGMPAVTSDSRIVTPADPVGIPAGRGVPVDVDTVPLSRSYTWRQAPARVDGNL